MAIIGIGMDCIELHRVGRLLHRFGDHFLRRILTEEETARVPATRHTSRCIEYVAARFAAKEAAVKALGTGFTLGISPRDVLVSNNTLGKPAIHLSGPALLRSQELGVTKIHVTLTHTRENAAAVVILE